MALMKIEIYPFDAEMINEMAEFVTSLILRSDKKGIKCEITSSGLIVKGNKETLLEVLEELDNRLLREIADRVSITLCFINSGESFTRPVSHSGVQMLN